MSKVMYVMCKIVGLVVLVGTFQLSAQTPTHWVTIYPERVAPDCSNPCERDAVIFVHGIFGSRTTWVNANGAYWPELMASDPDLTNFDIYRADYENFLISHGPSMEDVMRSFEEAMKSTVHQRRYRTVQFVAHSLGGNVVRTYLLHIKTRYGHRSLSVYRLLFMLGTPVEGSYFANVARLASANQLLRVLEPINQNDFLQLLNASVTDLSTKHRTTYCPSLKFLAAYEEKPTLVGIIVSKDSATKDSDESQGFERDHVSLPKPADRRDDVYKWVKNGMINCAKSGSVCPGPVRYVSPDCGNSQEP